MSSMAACALFGQGLDVQITGSDYKMPVDTTPKVGTLAWIKFLEIFGELLIGICGPGTKKGSYPPSVSCNPECE